MIVKRSAKFATQLWLPNFKIEDFFCRCGTCDPQKIDLASAVMLQALRDLVKRPIGINSAYRCPQWNLQQGGKPGSPHMEGLALDIYAIGMTGYDLGRAAWQIGWRAIGVAEKWVHVDRMSRDNGKDYAFWTYPPVDFVTTHTRFLRDCGYTGIGGN